MTRKKAIVTMGALFVASFAMIFLLAFLTKNSSEAKNGFYRDLISSTLKTDKQKTLPFSINRFTGIDGNNLYFQTTSPYEIVKTNAALDSFEIIKLSITKDIKTTSGFEFFLRGKLLYLVVRSIPAVIAYDLTSKKEIRYLLNNRFDKNEYISPYNFILSRGNVKSNKKPFIKIDVRNKDIQMEDKFSVNDGTAGFSTDGMLYYDQQTNLACYTYFYQNGFICMDTNLNLKLKARTIDTLTKQEIKVARVGSSVTMSQPPKYVSLMGCVWNGKLFVQSMLKGDNEYELDFSENTAIDIYNLLDGKYQGSFYIPKEGGKSPLKFQVIEDNLFAMYGKTITRHKLDFLKY